MRPEEWAANLLLTRALDAYEQETATNAGWQRWLVAGCEMLADHVPRALVEADYPVGTDDDWREGADVAYEAARKTWLSGSDDAAIIAAATSALEDWRALERLAVVGMAV